MDLLRIAARVSVADSGPTFTGELHSRFDGENNSGEGTIVMDGATHSITLQATASARGSEYTLDGKPVDPGSPEHEILDLFFTDIWPPEPGDWDATVNGNVIASPPRPVESE